MTYYYPLYYTNNTNEPQPLKHSPIVALNHSILGTKTCKQEYGSAVFSMDLSCIITFASPHSVLWFSCLCLKCHIFWTFAHAQCSVHLFCHVEFYFLFSQLIEISVLGQLCCFCQVEESSRFVSGNMKCTMKCYISSFSELWSLLMLSYYWGCGLFLGHVMFTFEDVLIL